jgi:hypothetical protein
MLCYDHLIQIQHCSFLHEYMSCSAKTKQNKQCRNKALNNHCCRTHQGQAGEGIFSDGYNFIKRRVKAVYEGSSRLVKYLDSTTSPVVKLEVCRKPIIKPVHKLLDAVSLGGFSRRQKKLGYDSVYHSYLLVTTADGKKVKLEKNHVVESMDAKPSDEENQRFDIPLQGKQVTIRDMINTASHGNESNFYKYKGGSNNCQKFVAEMVERNGLLPQEQESHQGLALQDSHHLISALPGGTYLANAVTNTAAVADRLLHGDGIGKRAIIKKKRNFYIPL